MPDALRSQVAWPTNSWTLLKKIIRAWYAAEEGGGEITQRKVAGIAKVTPSQVSMNKAFLQWMGIVQPEGIALTEGGKRLGLGLYHDNQRVMQQGLQEIIRDCPPLRDLLDIVRGRGNVNETDFEAEVSLRTKQGKTNPGFTTGVSVLKEILLDSGTIEVVGNNVRPTKVQIEVEKKSPERTEVNVVSRIGDSGLRKIPIPVSASAVWYIEVSENPDPGEVENFLEMQKLIFAKK